MRILLLLLQVSRHSTSRQYFAKKVKMLSLLRIFML